MNNFHEDHLNLVKVKFYTRLAEKCLAAAEAIQSKTDYEEVFTFWGNKYSLPRPLQSFTFCRNDHVWSYDVDNYRCIVCGHYKTLEPISVELPEEILI